MANEQVNVSSLLVILLLSGLIIRYLFFSSPAAGARPVASGSGQSGQSGQAGGQSQRLQAQREAACERIMQMFPQVERRAVLWDLHRNGGNVAMTTERVLGGGLERPPATFQPPPPPASSERATPTQQTQKVQEKPATPDLITRYKLHDKLASGLGGDEGSASGSDAEGRGKGKAWSANKEERQTLLQRRRDQMILEARRKMEERIKREKAAAGAPGGS